MPETRLSLRESESDAENSRWDSESSQSPSLSDQSRLAQSEPFQTAAAGIDLELRPENSRTDSETVQDARRLTVVKNLQRQLPDTRLRWAAFCDAHCKGTKDPGRHTKASLSRFLTSETPHVNAFWVKVIEGVTLTQA